MAELNPNILAFENSVSRRVYCIFFALLFLLTSGPGFGNSLSAQDKRYPELLGEFFSDEHRLVDSDTHRHVVREMRNTLQDSKIHVVLAVIERMSDYPDLDQEIEPFTEEVAEYWELGERRSKQGILVLFSIEDRKFHIAKTGDMSTKLTDEIKAKMLELPKKALLQNNVSLAMKRAANVLVEVVPSFDSEHGVKNIMGPDVSKKNPVQNRSNSNRQSTNRPTNRNSNVPQNRGHRDHNNKGDFGANIIAGFVCVAFAGFMIVASLVGVGFAAKRGFGTRRYGRRHGGGGDFLSGMITGGLLGSIFGGSNHGWGSGYHHEEHHHHHYGGGGGGGDDYYGGGGGGFDVGGYDYDADTFGGGDFDGGSTGEW